MRNYTNIFNQKLLTVSQAGFTLIELLIVVAIIGTLVTFTTVNYIGARQRARDAQRKGDIVQLRSALEMYRVDQSGYPPNLASCGSSLTNATGIVYMKKIPCDPINNGKYVYTYTSVGSSYTITTCLENVNDAQKDTTNNNVLCAGGSTNWSYTVTNP